MFICVSCVDNLRMSDSTNMIYKLCIQYFLIVVMWKDAPCKAIIFFLYILKFYKEILKKKKTLQNLGYGLIFCIPCITASWVIFLGFFVRRLWSTWSHITTNFIFSIAMKRINCVYHFSDVFTNINIMIVVNLYHSFKIVIFWKYILGTYR